MRRGVVTLAVFIAAMTAHAEDPKPKPEPILTGWEATVIRADDDNGDTPGERARQEHYRRQLTPGEIVQRQLAGQTAAPEAPARRAPRTPPAVDSSGSGVLPPGDGFSPGPAGDAAAAATPPESAKTPSTASAGKKASGLMNKMAGAFKSLGADAADSVKGPPGASVGPGPGAATSRATVSDGLAPRAAGSVATPGATPAGKPTEAANKPAVASISLPAQKPRALVKRPDFHQVLPSKDFAALKEVLAAPAADARPPLKDLGLSEDRRDITWKRSCDKVSGDCNPQAKGKDEGGYVRNEEVSPETLAAVLAAIDREMAAESAEPAPARGARRVAAASPDFTAPLSDSHEEESVQAVTVAGESAEPRAAETPREKGLWIFSLPAPGAGEDARAPRRALLRVLSGGGALALAWFFWRRRRGSTGAD